MSSELKYFMLKLDGIEKQLGGNSKLNKAQAGKSKDEFKNGEFKVIETMKTIKGKQNELDDENKGKTAVEIIKINAEIRSKINEFKGQINELDRILIKQKSQKKFKPDDIEAKEKRLKNYKTHLTLFENHLLGDFNGKLDEPELMSLEQLKLQIGSRTSTKVDYRSKEEELTAEEIAALNKFQDKDKEIDKVAIEIDDRLGDLYIKVNNMGEGIDHTNVQIQRNIAEVDKTSKELFTTNKKLKELIKKYRSPNRFCLDIACILLLLGLIAVIYNLAKK